MGTKKKYKNANDDRMQADDNMNGVRPKTEAWRPIHSRHAQNIPSTELISGSVSHGRADKHNQLPDKIVDSKEWKKKHKQMENLAGTQVQHSSWLVHAHGSNKPWVSLCYVFLKKKSSSHCLVK